MSTYADGVLYRIYNLDDKTDVTYHKREKGGGHMWIGYLSISSKDIYKITVGVAQTSEEAKDQMHNPPLEFQYYSGAVVYSDPGIRDFTLGMACAAIKAFQQNGISPINQAV